ncbi:MAG: hypothetical protein U0Z53_20975 [Blastocatellia bacterium]
MNPEALKLSTATRFKYHFVPDFQVITSYFNPFNYCTRRLNYEIFRHALRAAGLPCLTVECAFDQQPFTLPAAADVIQVRSRSLMWQKERLLNLAVSWLPPAVRYVAWIDCDVLFTSPDWAVQTVRLLQQYAIVQPFTFGIRLPQGHFDYRGEGDSWETFASVMSKNPVAISSGRFDDHGHTGFAWAARRELLGRVGLYEACVAGGADHAMAHAVFGDTDGLCIQRMMPGNPPQQDHFSDWAGLFYRETGGRIAAAPGTLLHLWHGELKDRRYLERFRQLAAFGFNPFTDIAAQPGRCLEWKTAKREMTEWFRTYFAARNEDGAEADGEEKAA